MPSNYSFLDDNLAGSAMPYELKDIEMYEADNISHIISLTPSKPLVSRYYEGDVLFHHYPVYATPDDIQLQKFVNLMKEIQEKGEKAVVHCQYGQERTGIFLVSYLVDVRGMNLQHAITLVREKRTGSLQTANAKRFLQERYS